MKYLTSFKKSTVEGNGDRDEHSAAKLRRLLKSLPSWKRWPLRHEQVLVECLRSIAEVVIWGDQNDAKVFEVFKDEDGLRKLLRLLRRKSNRRGPVAVQMLQTFAMLVQNIRDRHSMAYLLSHESVQHIISTDFDFGDEEVLGYYVSFVKSISLKLNESTVASFTERASQHGNAFSMPLFSEATKFIKSPERMVRSAARTLTLTIMRLKNDVVDRFLISDGNRGFFKDQVNGLRDKITALKWLPKECDRDKETQLKNDHLIAEIEDIICYLNDIYDCGSKGVQLELANAVWDEILGQHLIQPLFDFVSKQMGTKKHARSMSEEGIPFLHIPKVDTIMSIATEWMPFPESEFHKNISTTFIASTMNVLLGGSEFMYTRVIMQLINQAFHQLDKSAHERRVPLLNVDLEKLDLTEDPEWRIEATKIDSKMKVHLSPTIGPLEFAEYIGLDVCQSVLETLHQRTLCEKYKPSPLMTALAKNPNRKFKSLYSVPFLHAATNPIRVLSQSPLHRRLISRSIETSPLMSRRSRSC